ncbi:Homeodomain-like protein [Aspergillus pseudotamarii]|uniref:Homeodomain-like protein n=1 Tax=Aspergillus pseudotamarii TaxID=132259 RepID=A0A5N6SDY3_ASPPS|nr:Homeodomain-like protein [Aspergillus pseudotamarii]KAE8132872.1 Homeodomain-like protein [Aspergillus pseudotamarii]
MPRAPQKWTPEEDKLLCREVHNQLSEGRVRDWRSIADKIPGRTNKDCRKRWHNVLSGGLNKGYWTEEEDKLLTHAVQIHGETWTVVADVVKTRSADQCAKRWKQCLDPQLDRSEWTELENRRLMEACAVKGRRWKEIQMEHFPTRSRNSIKNQHTILTRRYNKLKNLREAQNASSVGTGTEDSSLSPSSCEDSGDTVDSSDDDSGLGSGSTEGSSGLHDPHIADDDVSMSINPTDVLPSTNQGIPGHHGFIHGPTWDMAGTLSGDPWGLPSVGETDSMGLFLNGMVPELHSIPPDSMHGFSFADATSGKDCICPSLLSPTEELPSDYSQGDNFCDDLSVSAMDTEEQTLASLQENVTRGKRCAKIVLTVEEPDNNTVESLVQIAFLSKSRFHFARE